MSASCCREWLTPEPATRAPRSCDDSHDFGDDASGIGIDRGGVGKAAGEVNFAEPELGEAFGVGCGVDVGEHELDVGLAKRPHRILHRRGPVRDECSSELEVNLVHRK